MRWGAGAGASRLISGNMAPHRRLEERLAEFKGYEAALLFGSGYLANIGTIAAPAPARRGRLLRRAQPRQHHRRLPALPGRDLRLPPRRPRAPRLGPARGGGARRADRHRRRLLDGRRRRAARGPGRAGAPPRLPADGRRGARDRRPRPRRARLGRRRGAERRGRRRRRHARQGARLLRRLRLRRAPSWSSTCSTRARPFIFSTAPAAAGARRRAGGAGAARSRAGAGRAPARQRGRRCARRSPPRGLPRAAGRPRSSRSRSATPSATMALCERLLERGVFAQGIRPPTVPEGTSRLRFTVMATHARGGAAPGREAGRRGGARARDRLGRRALARRAVAAA